MGFSLKRNAIKQWIKVNKKQSDLTKTMQVDLNLPISTLWPSVIHGYTCITNNLPLEVGKDVVSVYTVECSYLAAISNS